MKVSIYISENKERERNIGAALAEGFRKHGEDVETFPTENYLGPKGDTQVAVTIGLKGHSKKIFEDHRRAARHTILVDKSYFARKEYCRLSLDGFQSPYLNAISRPADRFDQLGVKLRKQRQSAKHVIYAGSSQKYCDWHDLGDATRYAESWCRNIKKTLTRTGRLAGFPIIYRPKPSWAALHPEDAKPIDNTKFSGPSETLASLLEDCYLLVTHGSNAAIEAIAAGVPVALISKEGVSAVWDLSEKNFDNFLKPYFPSDEARRQTFNNLAYWQFNADEMSSGLAWDILQAHTINRIAMTGKTDAERTIELYKMMHRGPKMFRGNSMKGHIEAVGGLIEKYQAQTLLDYGSGKGAQYDDLKLHDRWGGLKPTCYDPGYEPLATKPKGKFDGVLCTDVAEHIPLDGVDDFLRDVVSYATKFAFFCIYPNPSRKYLPDGRNCHLTVRPPEWWLDRIALVIGLQQDGVYMVRKPLPGGASEDFPHYVLKGEGKPDVIVTFRGTE